MKPILRRSISLVLVLAAVNAFAGSATWKQFPVSNNWNLANNWSPQAIPNGPSDTATFVTSFTPNISISSNIEVEGIVFGSNGITQPTAFTITVTPPGQLYIDQSFTNDSGRTQNFVARGGYIQFGIAESEVNMSLNGVSWTIDDGELDIEAGVNLGNCTFHNTGGTMHFGQVVCFGIDAGTATFTHDGG